MGAAWGWMTRPTSKAGPGNGVTDSQQFFDLVNITLRQLKHVPHLLDTDVQAECKCRPPALLGLDGRAIFVHLLVQPVHSTHCFVVMFDKERLTNVNSLCVCSWPSFCWLQWVHPNLVWNCIDDAVVVSLHNHHSILGISQKVKNILSSASPSLSQIWVEHHLASLSEGYLCKRSPLMWDSPQGCTKWTDYQMSVVRASNLFLELGNQVDHHRSPHTNSWVFCLPATSPWSASHWRT